MSSAANQAVGGRSASEQNFAAPAVTGGAHSLDTDTQDVDSHSSTTRNSPFDSELDALFGDAHSEPDPDPLFGGNFNFDFSWADSHDGSVDGSPAKDSPVKAIPAKETAPKETPTKETPPNNSQHSSGPDRYKIKASTANPTFPTVDPNYQNKNYPAIHEEFPKGTTNGNVAVGQAIDPKAPISKAKQNGTSSAIPGYHINANSNGQSSDVALNGGVSNPVSSQTAYGMSVFNGLSFPSRSDNATNPSAASSSNTAANSAASNSTQGFDFQVFSNGSVPKENIASALLFGPELQRALFSDGEASSDPQLPGSRVNNQAPTNSIPQSLGVNAAAAETIAEEEIVEPESPQRPPVSPPRLRNIAVTSSGSAGGPFGASHGRGANPNPTPDKPNTPQADKLRAEFWDWYLREMRLLYDYRKAYKAWLEFTRKNDNTALEDYEQKAESLKKLAITNQVAWTKYSRSFQKWKAQNPAVVPIIDNIHAEMRAVKLNEKAKADRVELENELRDKPEEARKLELAKFDEFANLTRESQVRELWRNRVETMKATEAMIQAKNQALIDEQNRIAEEQRKRAEAKAAAERMKAEARATEERKKAEAKAEEERKKAEAKAEEERHKARAAELARIEQAAREAEEAERQELAAKAAEDARLAEEERIALEAMGANANSGLQDFQF